MTAKRPLSPEWSVFSENPEGDHSLSESPCKHCGIIVKHNTKLQRVHQHLESCPNLTDSRKERKTGHWSSQDQKEFEDLLCLVSCLLNIPFNFVSYDIVKRLFQKVNPDITLPTRQKLSTDVLDRCSDQLKEEVKACIAKCPHQFTLMSDASSDVNSHPIINFIAASPSKSFLLKSVDSSGSRKTAEYLSQSVEAVMREHNLEGKIAGYISDNSSSNVSSWEILKRKYPKLFFYGCADHVSHLAAKDVAEFKKNIQPSCLTKNVHKAVEVSKDVSTLFKNNQILKYELETLQEIHHLPRLVLPGATRWGSHLNCLKRVEESLPDIQRVSYFPLYLENCNARQKTSREALKTEINDPALPSLLRKSIQVLEPLSKSILLFETNKTAISEVLPAFQDLKDQIQKITELTEQEKEDALKVVTERRSFIANESHLIGMFLDPRQDFLRYASQQELNNCLTLIRGYCSNGEDEVFQKEMDEFIHFKVEIRSSELFSQLVAKRISLFDFWDLYKSLFPKLFVLARQVFSLVCSTAEVERSFSLLNYLHSKTRNRLKHEKVAKMLFIKANYLEIHRDSIFSEDLKANQEVDSSS